MISKANIENIKIAAGLIRDGKLVAFPTETVYGLGANGLDPLAVAKIFEVKQRPSFNPLILHISDIKELHSICSSIDDTVQILIDKFWPGPLTLVLEKKDIVPGIVSSGLDTVAVRMPDNDIALELIGNAGVPVAAPSANTFGMLSPTSPEHVEKQLGNKVDMILDGGSTKVGVESTIIQVINHVPVLLRPGGLPVEEIERLAGKVQIGIPMNEQPNSPGQLPFHYSPKVPLRFIDEVTQSDLLNKKTGALFFKKEIPGYDSASIKILSPSGDLRIAAANLFSLLHELENEMVDLIIVERIEEKGLGLAIMDRLKKASNKSH
ncbi:MAG: threonylcarbamoyl-AMP synthase [Melioribacteraceae bacterium]|nr:threonylcarbamoyl-AMP synthase [Melioribacteraceae bacterium]MCF8355074.1 threonylcarbamoyl-AMP synthase [Melioribacteraceae bacterium]MCF8395667.1 threonylcarbamoyl-AMP synthase [Melioribacteraceae bacterium]MCF8420292.1 threonylcarbamoyl-AMP synthase [Melioribacteraceae bacterium]